MSVRVTPLPSASKPTLASELLRSRAPDAFDETRSVLPAPEPESHWGTRLPHGSFLFEPQGGLYPGRRFRGYDIVIRDGRVKRVPAGSEEAGAAHLRHGARVRSQHAFDYPAAHRLTSSELETQIDETEPFQPGSQSGRPKVEP